MSKIIAWFSAGVTSAVACKLALDKYGDDVVPIYIHIDSAHDDNDRFIYDCENWYGRKILVRQSQKYKDQFDVIEKTKYVNGTDGARCTLELKKKVRYDVEDEFNPEHQIFGFEYNKKQINRAIRFKEQYPSSNPLFPLISSQLTKPNCMSLLLRQGIKLPVMYDLGYGNNNCIGCVKGGGGYWNKIRVDFPDEFEKMKQAEIIANHSCIKGKFLKDLNPNFGRKLKAITPDCGTFCDLEFTDIMDDRVDLIMSGQLTIDF